MRLFLMFSVLCLALAFADHDTLGQSQELWVGKDGNIRNVYAKDMFTSGDDFYLATKSEVYKSKDIKEGWEPVFSIPAGENEINCIGGHGKIVFVGTKKGLYKSEDRGKSWNNVFRTVIPGKNCVICIDDSRLASKKILIGTEGGVFLSDDLGNHWQNISENLKDRVNCLAFKGSVIFAGGDSGLYIKTEGSRGWQRIFVISKTEKAYEEEVPEEAIEEDETVYTAVNCISVSGKRLYIGTGKKILYSDDGGKSWRDFPCGGLTGTVNSVLSSDKLGKLYCATDKGAFEFCGDKAGWLELYKGMGKKAAINNIAFDGGDEGHLWALSDKGVYRLESGMYMIDQRVDVEKNYNSLKNVSGNEPTFKELQKAAIKFAEVSPEKIANWRTEARLKALMPKVSLGLKKDRSNSYEIYTSATKDYVVTGPDDISNGWDVSVSWELADLIWSTDQTSIDVRSKLMVQLRNDILDDLRRAYYERKRIQYELATEPPEDPKARFEKEMRLAELTQAVDDLTGNYLSEHIRKSDDKLVHSP